MARPSFRRFHPSAFTPQEAYARATQTPRAVRQLGEAVVGWALTNFGRDLRSAGGNLPELFGFRPLAEPGPRTPMAIAISDHTTLAISANALCCTSVEGSTVLSSDNFEPSRVPRQVDPLRALEVIAVAGRCVEPLDWILGWNHAAAALRQVSEYEAWVRRRHRSLRSSDRPKAARKTEVTIADLPAALSALAEWSDDAEQAMLAWIIADAKARGVEPELPMRFRPRPTSGLRALFGR